MMLCESSAPDLFFLYLVANQVVKNTIRTTTSQRDDTARDERGRGQGHVIVNAKHVKEDPALAHVTENVIVEDKTAIVKSS